MIAGTLFCAPAGEGSVFSVAIDTNKSVGQLIDAIKSHSPKTIICVYSVLKRKMTQDNQALQNKNKNTSFVEASDACKLDNPFRFGPNVLLGENAVHVLAVAPHVPHLPRLKRWKKLNELLDKNKKPRLANADESDDMETTCDSYDSEKVTTGDNIATPDTLLAYYAGKKLNKLLARNKKAMDNYCEDTPTVASSGDSFISFEDCEKIMGRAAISNRRRPSRTTRSMYSTHISLSRPDRWVDAYGERQALDYTTVCRAVASPLVLHVQSQ